MVFQEDVERVLLALWLTPQAVQVYDDTSEALAFLDRYERALSSVAAALGCRFSFGCGRSEG
jgi:hypothetical protein